MTSRRDEPASSGEEMRSLLIGMMMVEVDDGLNRFSCVDSKVTLRSEVWRGDIQIFGGSLSFDARDNNKHNLWEGCLCSFREPTPG